MARSAGLKLAAIGLVLVFGAAAHAEISTNKLAANKLAANKLAANRLAANKLAANRLASNRVRAGEGAVVDIVGVELRSGESFRR